MDKAGNQMALVEKSYCRKYATVLSSNIFTLMKKILIITGLALTTLLTACHNTATTESTTKSDTAVKMNITESTATYTADSVSPASFVAYDASKKGPLPVVFVIPEWWGLTDYAKMRARELAKLGYFAMAVDMYGSGRTGETPDAAGKFAMPFYSSEDLVKSRKNLPTGRHYQDGYDGLLLRRHYGPEGR
jgi:uncharacterized cupredoxin-like copper-binding protein